MTMAAVVDGRRFPEAAAASMAEAQDLAATLALRELLGSQPAQEMPVQAVGRFFRGRRRRA
ncbi:unnamed protein product [Effrenium voratum]|nr:unnamed protein product [Effrenium voratum]